MLTHFKRFTLTNVKGLVYEGFSKVTPLEWQKLIKHVEEKVENHYWRAENSLNVSSLTLTATPVIVVTVATVIVTVVKMLAPWKKVMRLNM